MSKVAASRLPLNRGECMLMTSRNLAQIRQEAGPRGAADFLLTRDGSSAKARRVVDMPVDRERRGEERECGLV